jgi:hypothetical protein
LWILKSGAWGMGSDEGGRRKIKNFTTEAQRTQSHNSFARSGDTDRAKKLSPSGITLLLICLYLFVMDNIP